MTEGRRIAKKIVVVVFVIVLILISLYWFQESNIYYLLRKISLVNPANPNGAFFGKIDLIYRTLVSLPYENGLLAGLFGIGVGAYSSRASWILSGDYLQSQGNIPIAPSEMWQRYLGDLWNKDLLETFRWAHGVANQPMSSWISILGEMGYLGILLVLLLLSVLLTRYNRAMTKCVEADKWQYQISILITLIVGISMFFDNWIEYPQLMMFVVVVLSITYRIGKFERRYGQFSAA